MLQTYTWWMEPMDLGSLLSVSPLQHVAQRNHILPLVVLTRATCCTCTRISTCVHTGVEKKKSCGDQSLAERRHVPHESLIKKRHSTCMSVACTSCTLYVVWISKRPRNTCEQECGREATLCLVPHMHLHPALLNPSARRLLLFSIFNYCSQPAGNQLGEREVIRLERAKIVKYMPE